MFGKLFGKKPAANTALVPVPPTVPLIDWRQSISDRFPWYAKHPAFYDHAPSSQKQLEIIHKILVSNEPLLQQLYDRDDVYLPVEEMMELVMDCRAKLVRQNLQHGATYDQQLIDMVNDRLPEFELNWLEAELADVRQQNDDIESHLYEPIEVPMTTKALNFASDHPVLTGLAIGALITSFQRNR